ncbi:MAG TPA: hypothetical protein VH280_11450 [Verrucomicrobiae bacterium]|jgi:hypothetical protein|nr:hypothetical protein [Verrucomicrobiae bacterium]
MKEENDALIEKLNLGRDVPIDMNPRNWKKPEFLVARWLYFMLELFRKAPMPPEIKPEQFDEMPLEMKLDQFYERARSHNESRKRAQKLRPFSRKNYREWFEASWPMFESQFTKEFQDQKCFEKFRPIAEKIAAKEQKKIRGVLRRYIKNRILFAFKALAPKVDLPD